MPKKVMMSEVLKRAVNERLEKHSLNSIAKDADIDQAGLFRFMAEGENHRDLRLKTAEKLADYLGLALLPNRSK